MSEVKIINLGLKVFDEGGAGELELYVTVKYPDNTTKDVKFTDLLQQIKDSDQPGTWNV